MDASMGTLHLSEVVKVALGLGLGTLALRLGGAELRQRLTLPTRLQEALQWLPVAALAAMISPIFAPSANRPVEWTFLLAAGLSAWLGYRSRNMLWGVGGGMLAYWLLRWLGA